MQVEVWARIDSMYCKHLLCARRHSWPCLYGRNEDVPTLLALDILLEGTDSNRDICQVETGAVQKDEARVGVGVGGGCPAGVLQMGR